MEAHGGYLLRVESLAAIDWVQLGREALAQDGESPHEVGLTFSMIPRRKVVRVAYDAPFAHGARGARWYVDHSAFAKIVSARLGITVHAYAIDPDAFEEVIGYGNGRRVGGESLRYENAEMPDDDELDDAAFARMQAKWPLGHIAYVFGVTREDLIRLPRTAMVLLPLDGAEPPALSELFAGF